MDLSMYLWPANVAIQYDFGNPDVSVSLTQQAMLDIVSIKRIPTFCFDVFYDHYIGLLQSFIFYKEMGFPLHPHANPAKIIIFLM
jgi:hypothetical protein